MQGPRSGSCGKLPPAQWRLGAAAQLAGGRVPGGPGQKPWHYGELWCRAALENVLPLLSLQPALPHPLQVNYHYQLDRLHDRNRTYLVDGQVPAAAAVETLLLPSDDAL